MEIKWVGIKYMYCSYQDFFPIKNPGNSVSVIASVEDKAHICIFHQTKKHFHSKYKKLLKQSLHACVYTCQYFQPAGTERESLMYNYTIKPTYEQRRTTGLYLHYVLNRLQEITMLCKH